MDCGWVCRVFKTSLRSEVLSFHHYREITALMATVAGNNQVDQGTLNLSRHRPINYLDKKRPSSLEV
jgi:hypothetical protein